MNKKIAIYIRCATKDDLAISSQMELLKQVAINNGCLEDCIRVYSDNGVPGISLDRPGLRQMMNDLDSDTIVLAQDAGRIARNTADILQIDRMVQNKGSFIYCVEGNQMARLDRLYDFLFAEPMVDLIRKCGSK